MENSMSLATHTAAGQAAGYFFQPERALFWLAKCPAGSSVGIETEDDVLVGLLSGDKIREQAKHTVQPGHKPFGDRSKDLWNTLAIWLRGINDGEIVLARSMFYLTTNATLPDCIVKRLANPERKLDNLVNELRVAGESPPDIVAKQVSAVLANSDSALQGLLARITLDDGSNATSGHALRVTIAGLLHLPNAMPWGDLLDGLGGWVYHQTLSMWRAQKPAIITRDAFDTQYQRLLQIHRQRFRKAKPEHLLPVSASEVDSFKEHVFVKQLRAVSLADEDEEVTTAITDFIRCGVEQFRLSREGDLAQDDIMGFEGNLVRRWREICRNRCKMPAELPADVARDVGYAILADALQHREPLCGVTQEPYITTGSFHRLSDAACVWWNPHYPSDKERGSAA
jgi:hypothetical protein